MDEPEVAGRATGTGSPVHASDTLAQADRMQTAQASTVGQSAGPSAKPPVTVASPRLDFDLEQGIPMPPDAWEQTSLLTPGLMPAKDARPALVELRLRERGWGMTSSIRGAGFRI